MANEFLLLAGNQIATYSAAQVTFPDGHASITLTGISSLGNEDSRFFLVRTQGEGDIINNGEFFAVFAAVDDGSGNLVPAATPVVGANFATPDSYGNVGAGDSYIILGLHSDPKFVVDFDGFDGSGSAIYNAGEDVDFGGDGEMSITELEAANPDEAAICFARGTMIRTPQGERLVESLTVGQEVVTPSGQTEMIRWIGRNAVTSRRSKAHLTPIRIRRDAFGEGRPYADLLVSPNHRVTVSTPMAELWFGTNTVFVPAKHLVDGERVVVETGARSVEYWHFLFDTHETVYSNGLESESLHPGDVALSSVSQEARAEVLELFPEWSDRCALRIRTKHHTLRAYEAKLLGRTLVAPDGSSQRTH